VTAPLRPPAEREIPASVCAENVQRKESTAGRFPTSERRQGRGSAVRMRAAARPLAVGSSRCGTGAANGARMMKTGIRKLENMENPTPRIGVVVVAGGSGTRMGGNLPKQFMLLDGEPILARTVNNFAEALPGAEIVVVLPADYIDFWHDYARRFSVAEHRTAAGGAERFHSVANGIAALSEACDLIAVQDGVRPLATHDCIRRIVQAAAAEGSAVPVVEPVDSLRLVTSGGGSHPVDRKAVRIVQTPQVFRAAALRAAYARGYDPAFTDDAAVFEAAGGSVRLVEGEAANLKITTRDDLAVAEAILALRSEA